MLPTDMTETCIHTLSLLTRLAKQKNESLSKPYGQKQVDLRALLQGQNSDA